MTLEIHSYCNLKACLYFPWGKAEGPFWQAPDKYAINVIDPNTFTDLRN